MISALSSLRPLPVISFQSPLRPPATLPRLNIFGADQLNISSNLRAQEGPQNLYAFTIEQAKLEHEAPSLNQLPDFKISPLRIGLDTDQKQARFQLSQGQVKVQAPDGSVTQLEQEQGEFEVQAIEGGFKLKHQGQDLGSFQGKLIVENQANTMVINGQIYRGGLEVMPSPTNPFSFHVINPVLLEDYLLSVVPSESPASWPLESLKAQALAARTYAVANWGKHNANGFDMKDDTSDQMYRGVVTEHPGPTEAIKSTAHQIISHNGKPINALFFSCSGGMTDSSQEVWGVELPYIQPVPDFDQAAPRYRWNLNKTQADLQQAAAKLGVSVGQIREIKPLSFTPQGRVKSLQIIGSNGSAEVDSNKFRFAAGLYSTFWKVSASGSGNNRQFSFSGGGWGHGLGMSQYGARQMAADGKSAEEIIKHFYLQTAIQSL